MDFQVEVESKLELHRPVAESPVTEADREAEQRMRELIEAQCASPRRCVASPGSGRGGLQRVGPLGGFQRIVRCLRVLSCFSTV